MNLFDIEQIEVLRGPQGAFYGRNSVAGAFNIVTKQPTNEFEGFVSALYGTGDQFETTAGFSGPIIEDKVLFPRRRLLCSGRRPHRQRVSGRKGRHGRP